MNDNQPTLQPSANQNTGDAAPPLTIRPARVEDAAAMARVHVDTWRTTYPGIVSAEHLANLSYERSEQRWREHLTNPGAQMDFTALTPSGEVVGIASGGPVREPLEHYDGELYGLYIRQAWQGGGLGRRMLTVMAQHLAGRGFQSMILWVLKDNLAARGFYEKLGGRLSGEEGVSIGGQQLLKVAYAWPDLQLLALLRGPRPILTE